MTFCDHPGVHCSPYCHCFLVTDLLNISIILQARLSVGRELSNAGFVMKKIKINKNERNVETSIRHLTKLQLKSTTEAHATTKWVLPIIVWYWILLLLLFFIWWLAYRPFHSHTTRNPSNKHLEFSADDTMYNQTECGLESKRRDNKAIKAAPLTLSFAAA